MRKIAFLLSVFVFSLTFSLSVQAQSSCPDDFYPVCGVDGNTYQNRCSAGTIPIAYATACEGKNFNEETRPFILKLKWGYFEPNEKGILIPINGKIELDGEGKVFEEGTMLFEERDSVFRNNPSKLGSLSWSTLINEDYDGIKLRIEPSSNKQKVKIEVGEWKKEMTIAELKKMNTIVKIDEKDHQLEIKNLGTITKKPVLLYVSWGKLPEFSPNWTDVKKSWKGSILASGHKVELLRTLFFNPNDTLEIDIQKSVIIKDQEKPKADMPDLSGCRIIPENGEDFSSNCPSNEQIVFTSITENHFSGLMIKVPVTTPEVTLELTNIFKQKFSYEELQKIDMIKQVDNQGNYIRIYNVYQKPLDLFSKTLDQRTNTIKKIREWEGRIMQLKSVFGIDIINVRNLLLNIQTYDVPGNLFSELENTIGEALLASFSTDITRDKAIYILTNFEKFMVGFLEKSKNMKYQQNLIPFKDTDTSVWFYQFAGTLKRLNIISGYKDANGIPTGIFGGENNVTFGEAFKMVINATEKGETSAYWNKPEVLSRETAAFTAHWSQRYYQIARFLQIPVVWDKNAAPNNPMERGQVMALLIHALQIDVTDMETNCFPDIDNQYKYAKEVCKAKQLNIVSGNPDGNFAPTSSVNRAAIAKIITKTLEIVGDERVK